MFPLEVAESGTISALDQNMNIIAEVGLKIKTHINPVQKQERLQVLSGLKVAGHNNILTGL